MGKEKVERASTKAFKQSHWPVAVGHPSFHICEQFDSKAHPDISPGAFLGLFVLVCVLHTWKPEAKMKVLTFHWGAANSERRGLGKNGRDGEKHRSYVIFDHSACLFIMILKETWMRQRADLKSLLSPMVHCLEWDSEWVMTADIIWEARTRVDIQRGRKEKMEGVGDKKKSKEK